MASSALAGPPSFGSIRARIRCASLSAMARAIVLSAEKLRVESPSAEVRGHGGQKPPPLRGKANVKIQRLEPVGNYAVRIVFDDGHDSGLYSWDYLKRLADA